MAETFNPQDVRPYEFPQISDNEPIFATNESIDYFPNLAMGLNDDILREIGDMVVEGYKDDEASRSDWLADYKESLRLFHVRPEHKRKDTPWDGASNLVVPTITTACIQFWARSSDAIFGTKNIVKAHPVSRQASDYSIGRRIQRHMDYQIRYEMEDFEDDFNASLMQLPLSGTVIRKTYYDPVDETNTSEFIRPEDFVINYWARSIRKSHRHTHIIRENINDIRIKGDTGVYVNTEGLDHGSVSISESVSLKISEDENNGTEAAREDSNTPRITLEQHTYLALFDDSGRLLSEEKRKTAIRKRYIVKVDLETHKVYSIIENKNPNTGKPMEFFTKYTFLASPDKSFYGIGFGKLLRMSNEAQNTLLNQLIDAGLLANTQSGFFKKHTGMAKGVITLTQGVFKEVDLKGSDDIHKSIMAMPFRGPESTLFSLLGYLKDNADRLTTVTDAMTGEMPRSDTTATGVVSLLEQGLKVFKAIYRGIHKSFSKELVKLHALNGIYLNEDEYREIVIDEDELIAEGIPIDYAAMVINKSDYIAPFTVIPISDPNITSKAENAAKAQFLYETSMTNPLIQSNPISMFNAYKQYVESIEYDPSKVNQVIGPIQDQIAMQEEQARQERVALGITAEMLERGEVPPEMMQNALAQLVLMSQAEGGGGQSNEQKA